MPKYEVEVPGHGKYEVESQTELSDYQAYQAAQNQIKAEPKPDTGFTGAFKASVEKMKGEAALTAGKLGLMNEQEAENFHKGKEEAAKQMYKPTEEGWTEAPLTKFKELLGGSAPYMAAPLAVGTAAALAGPALGVGAVGGIGVGALGAFGASAAQFTGSNLARQMEEGSSLHDASLAKAAAASVPQAILDTASLKMTPVIRNILFKAGKEVSEKTAETIAKQGLLAATGRMALAGVKSGVSEGLTEAGQQVFERLQAGLNLTDEKAREEYFDNFIGGAALGGVLGGFGHAFDKPGKRQETPAGETAPTGAINPPVAPQQEAQEERYVSPPSIDPLKNPLGNFTRDEAPEIYDHVQASRAARGKPALPTTFSIEDMVDAGAPKQAIDSMVANKSGWNGEKVSPSDVLNRAQQKNIDTSTKGFRDFLRRATGTEDINALSEPQLFVAAKALDAIKPGEEQRILEPGTNALHYTPDQYSNAVNGLRSAYAKKGDTQLDREEAIQAVMDSTGLKEPIDAERVLNQAIEEGHIDQTRETETEAESFKPSDKHDMLPGGFDIREEAFKQGDEPEEHDVKAGSQTLSSHPSLEKAEETMAQHVADRTKELNSRQKEIEKLNKDIENRNRELVRLQSIGEGNTFDFYSKAAEADAKNKEDQATIEKIKAEQAQFAQPLKIVPRGTKPKNLKTRHALYKNDKRVDHFDDQYQAERHGISLMTNDELRNIVEIGPKLKGLRAKRYAVMAKDELGYRENPSSRPKPKAAFDPKLKEKMDTLRQALLPTLKKFGLEKVGLRIEESIMGGKANGEFAENIIRIALDAENNDYMGTLRHESIHALKELGAFTPAEWKTLETMAKKEWINKFLGDRLNAYREQYKSQNGNLDGFDAYIQEEAIADAFKHFSGTKPPAGFVANLMRRLNELFKAIKQAFGAAGYKSSDEIFRGIEEGQYRPAGETTGEAKYALKHDLSTLEGVVQDGIQKYADALKRHGVGQFEGMGDLPARQHNAISKIEDGIVNRLKPLLGTDSDRIAYEYVQKNIIPAARESVYQTGGKGKYSIKNLNPVMRRVAEEVGLNERELLATSLSLQTGLPGDAAYEKQKMKGIPEVIKFIEDRRNATGTPLHELNIKDEGDREILAKLITAEAMAAIRAGGNAIDWYDGVINKTMAVAAVKYPELNKDENARTAFKLAMAITSQGMNVEDNIKFASGVYEKYRKNNTFPEVGTGGSAKVMKNSFKLANEMISDMGMDKFREFLQKPFTVKEINDMGFKVSGELKSEKVLGSIIFGSKIGFGFYSNLSGNFDPVTMDMWFMRTIGRLTGKLKDFDPKRFAKQVEKLRASLDERGKNGIFADSFDPELVERARTDDEAAIELARKIKSTHEKDFKENRTLFDEKKRAKSNLVLSAEPILKSVDKPIDVPGSGGNKHNLRDVFAKVRNNVKRIYGTDIPSAALQALIWYPEQSLYKQLGVRLRVTNQDYAGAIQKLLLAEGYDAKRISAAIKSAAGRGKQVSGKPNAAANQAVGEESIGSNEKGKFSLKAPTTPEFKQWFKGSKVVDENGNPLVMYHGGSFSPEDPRGFLGVNWFTSSISDAEYYADQLGTDVVSVYISAKNPRIVQPGEETNTVVETVDKSKFDSVYDPSSGDWIVWDGKKIKSATENTGAFSSKSNDIRYSMKGANSAPHNYTKMQEQRNAGRVIKDAVDNINAKFNQDAYTDWRIKWVDTASGVTKTLQGEGIFDTSGQLRADGLLHAKNQAINLIRNGMLEGVVKVNSDGTLGVEYTDKNLARSLVLADELDAHPMVKGHMASGRQYIAEIARALRAKDILAEDKGLRELGAQQLEESKHLLALARTITGRERERKVKQAYALRKQARKNLAMNRERKVEQDQIDWAEKQYANNDKVREILGIWKHVNDSLVDLGVETGWISKEDAATYKSRKNYVPLYLSRDDLSEDSFFNLKGTGVKTSAKVHKLKGSEEDLNIWENMDKHYASMVARSYENQTRRAGVAQLVWAGVAHITNSRDDNHNIVFKDAGREVYAIVENPNDLAAFQVMQYQMGPIMKAFGVSTKVLRFGALVNPMYWIKQLIKDPIHAYMTGTTGLVTPFHSARAFLEILAHNSKEAKILASRGVIGPVGTTEDIYSFLSEAGKDKADPKSLNKAMHKVMQIHEASDAATRVEIYKKAYKEALAKGYSEDRAVNEAVHKARESINFSNRGNSPILNSLRQMIPFLSAQITSLDTVYRAMTGYGLNPEEKAEARRIFRSRAMLLMMSSLAYSMLMQDDDEYKKLPDYIKDDNWLMPSPLGNGFIKIPTPFEVGFLFKAIPEMGVRYLNGTSTGKEVMISFRDGFLKNIPAQGLPIPQATKPILETITNHSFFTGNSIEGMADQGKPVATRGARASETAKLLSAAGLDKLTLSPAKIDNLFQGFAAELGTFSLGMIDQAIYSAEGKNPPPKNIEQLPFMKSFLTDRNVDRAVSEFYKIESEAKQTVQGFNDLKAHGQAKQAVEYISDEEHKKMFNAAPALRRIGQQMTNIRKQMNMIEGNEDIPADVRRQRLNDLTQLFNRVAENGLRVSSQLGLR